MRVDEDRLTATYMLANRKHGTLYLGSALDLIARVQEHKDGRGSAFTRKYGVTKLVWYKSSMLVSEARDREYAMKKWRRDWKTNLIERDNPNWDDLYPALIGAALPSPIPGWVPDLIRGHVRDPYTQRRAAINVARKHAAGRVYGSRTGAARHPGMGVVSGFGRINAKRSGVEARAQ